MVVVGGAWRIPVGKPFASLLEFPDLEGVVQRVPERGRKRSPWLLTTWKSWDDPPSGGGRGGFSDFLGMKLTSAKNLLAVLGRLPSYQGRIKLDANI